MIQILQGKQIQIDSKLMQTETATAPIYIYDAADFPKGWAGLRTLIYALKERYSAQIDSILHNHKALATFIFPELEISMTAK